MHRLRRSRLGGVAAQAGSMDVLRKLPKCDDGRARNNIVGSEHLQAIIVPNDPANWSYCNAPTRMPQGNEGKPRIE